MTQVEEPRTRPALELLVAAIATVVTVPLVHLAIWGTNFWVLDPTSPGIGPLWAAAMVALALVGYAAQRRLAPNRARLVVAVLSGAAAGMVMAPLMAGLHGTPQPPFTVLRGDMMFRTEYVTRFASTWHLDDYTYGGLSAFYPPAWFWLAGRSAHYLGIEPWRIVKPFTIGTIGVSLALALVLWRRVLTPAGALAAAIGSSLVLTRQGGPLDLHTVHATQGWYSPYSCLVAVVGVAWLAATWTAVRERASRRGWALLVVLGALLALCYYLLFIILAIVLVLLTLFTRGERPLSLRRAGGVLAGIGALTAIFWVPLIASVLGGAASQGHYLAPDFLSVSVAFDGPAELVVLAVAGTAALALGSAWPAGRALVALIAATVVYQLLSVTSLVLSDNQLQPHRAVTMLWAALGAAVPVALEGFARPRSLAAGLPPAATRAIVIVLAVVATGATFTLGARLGTDLATGPLTVGAHDTADMGVPIAMGRFITQTTGRPAHDVTLLSGEKDAVLIVAPFNGYLPLRARYAHPEAHLPHRVRAIRAAAACLSTRCTTRALTQTPFGSIDAVILGIGRSGYTLHTQLDAFPRPRAVTIDFRPSAFDPAVWAQRRFGGFVVLVRRAAGSAGITTTSPL